MGASPGASESFTAQPPSTRMAGQEFSESPESQRYRYFSEPGLTPPSPAYNSFERAAQQAFGGSPTGLMLQKAILGGLGMQNKKRQG